ESARSATTGHSGIPGPPIGLIQCARGDEVAVASSQSALGVVDGDTSVTPCSGSVTPNQMWSSCNDYNQNPNDSCCPGPGGTLGVDRVRRRHGELGDNGCARDHAGYCCTDDRRVRDGRP